MRTIAAASRCRTNACLHNKEYWNVESDDNDEDYQESDAKVDDEETIDTID